MRTDPFLNTKESQYREEAGEHMRHSRLRLGRQRSHEITIERYGDVMDTGLDFIGDGKCIAQNL